MAFLNKQERDALLDDIKDMRFQQIRGYVNRKDPKTRLAYFRNVQQSGKWMTRYVLEGLGTQVTLVEQPRVNERTNRRKYEIEEIIVEPTADNRL
ncbi:MAG: hypothetical protein KC496_09675 [Anaerolineae bacterium]|nr:hypothetical protein [Anaerolineae bacterium]